MNNYYLYKHNFHNALITNDSLIKYAWMTSQSNVPGLLDINSQIYEAMEDNKNAVVLVSVSSIKDLRNAYPSYFLDTSEFIRALEKISQNCRLLKWVKE